MESKKRGARVVAEGRTAARDQVEANAMLASIVEHSSDAIFSKTLEGIITSWNKGAWDLYGYSPEEMVGTSVEILVPPDKKDEWKTIMKSLRKGEKIEILETERIRKDGSRVEVSLSISPVQGADGTLEGASTIARNISHLKETERKKDEFLSIASHELKTPLATLKVYAQILERRLTKSGDDRNTYFFSKIDIQIDKLTKLVNDLLDVSKIEAGKLKLDIVPFDLNELVRKTVVDFQFIADSHKIERETGEKLVVCGDEDRVGQVLVILLNNAIKYSPKADRVTVRTEQKGGQAVVSVTDMGVGIEKKDQGRMFERFFRASKDPAGGESGFGLGLYIASEIIKRHNGQIGFKSKKGKGSTFFFSLPLC